MDRCVSFGIWVVLLLFFSRIFNFILSALSPCALCIRPPSWFRMQHKMNIKSCRPSASGNFNINIHNAHCGSVSWGKEHEQRKSLFFVVWMFSTENWNSLLFYFHLVITWNAWIMTFSAPLLNRLKNARNALPIRNSISPFSCDALLLIHTYVNRFARTIAATKFHIHTLFSYKTYYLQIK